MLYYLSIITLILTASAVYHNYYINKNTLFLGGYLFSLSLYTLVHYIVFESDSILAIAILFRHFSPIFYLPGALIYLYIRGILNNKQSFSKKDLLHFIPFIISTINILPYFFTPFSLKLELAEDIYAMSNFSKLYDQYLFYPFYLSAFIRSGLLISYVGACFYQLWKHKIHFSESLYSSKQNLYRWLIFITTSAFVMSICLIAISFIFYIRKDVVRTEVNTHFFVILAGASFVFIPLAMIFFPTWVYGEKALVSTAQSKPIPTLNKVEVDLKKEELDKLATQIIACFEIQKPYLHKDFSLDQLSELLDVPKYQIYNALNSSLCKKFTQLRATYRVEHAKRLLSTVNLENISLEEIWTKSGFSSKSNFFTTFKEETGVTPTEYTEQIKTSFKKQ